MAYTRALRSTGAILQARPAMKILLLTNAFARVTNGPAKFAHYLLEVKALLPGHEVRVLSEDMDGPEARAAMAAGTAYPMHLHIPAWAKPLGQWIRMRQYYRRALELRAEYPWDMLVYINAYQADYALTRGKVPVLGMINDDNNSRAIAAKAWRSRTGFKYWLFRQFEERAARLLPFVIVNSRYLAGELGQAYGLRPERLPVLYKSVDADSMTYQPVRRWPQEGEPWRILFVKTDFRRGGLADLAQALARLPEYRFEVEAAGPAEGFRAEAEALFAGLPHIHFRFLGPQPQSAVREKLYQAHIFCVPARMEALGVANMEAALAGTPIVSTRAGGIPEVLDDGRAAFLAEPGDAASLAAALQQGISDAHERVQRQAHARRFVEQTFAKETMLRRFIALAEQAFASPLPRSNKT